MPRSCAPASRGATSGESATFYVMSMTGVDLETVWHTVTDHLPPLKASVTTALKTREQA